MNRKKITDNITIENARIGFKNFEGRETPYNPAGKRNFCVFLEEELAQKLIEDGWNVRRLQAREEGEPDLGYLQVAVSYGNVPPKIVTITSRGKTILSEDDLKILDWADIKEVDLIIRPYNWVLQEGTRAEKRGVKAYVKAMYITLVEDEFESKYYGVPQDHGDVNAD